MSKNHQSWLNHRLLRVGAFAIFALLVLARFGYAQTQFTDNLSFEFFCPVRLCESSRECKIGKGAILIKYSPLADLCIPEALTQPDRAKKLKTQVDSKNIILQGSIHIQPAKAIPGDQTGKIQPGTPVKVMVTVENKGEQASPAGQLLVRYAFAHPLDKEVTSVVFETEKKPLPVIEPGKKVEIAFDTPHQIPSLLDFIRHDWSLREYQAVAMIDQEEYLIGTLAITFSAHYYPGVKKEFPVKIYSN